MVLPCLWCFSRNYGVLCHSLSVKTIGEDTRFVGKKREMKDSNLLWRIGENPDSMVEKHDASCLRGIRGQHHCDLAFRDRHVSFILEIAISDFTTSDTPMQV
jgi:hypothetical protein